MLHLSTEMYNNEQVSKVFRQNFSKNMPKMHYLPQNLNPQNCQALEALTPDV